MKIHPTSIFALVFASSAAASSLAAQASSVDVPIKLSLQKRAVIGGSDDAAFAPAALFAGDVAVDAAGKIYVLDRAESVIRVYNANGKSISKVGRKGGGPGEFSAGRQLGVTPSGSIVVTDNGKNSFVKFDAQGKPLPEQSVRPFSFVQGILSTNGSQMVLYATVRDTDMVVRVNGEKVERLVVFPPHAKKEVTAFDVCGVRGTSRPPLLSDRLIAGGNQRLTITNTTSQFSFTIFEAGKPARKMSRNREPERVTMSVAREILGDSQLLYIGSGMRRCAVATDAIAKEAGMASVVPTYERIVVDQADNFWALRAAPQKKSRLVDIYHATAGYRGTANIGGVDPIAFLPDGSLLSLEKDADDAPMIVIYSVRR